MRSQTENVSYQTGSRINWGAIFGGTFIAMFFQVMLGLLGLAIGLSVLNPNAPSAQNIGIGTGMWLLLATIISVFIGAFAAGRFAGIQGRYDGLLHGVATLAFLTVLSLFTLGTGIGSIAGGALSFGLQAAQTPQVQQIMPSGPQAKQATGAAAPTQLTPQQQQALRVQANKYAARASWIAFLTTLFSLIAAAIGGFLGMQSRVRQASSEAV